jgi:hypothetical protein
LVWIQKWTKEGLPAGRLCQRSSWLRSWASLVGSRLGKSLCILNEEVICFGLYQHFKDLASLFKDLRKKPHKNRINTPKKKKKQTNTVFVAILNLFRQKEKNIICRRCKNHENQPFAFGCGTSPVRSVVGTSSGSSPLQSEPVQFQSLAIGTSPFVIPRSCFFFFFVFFVFFLSVSARSSRYTCVCISSSSSSAWPLFLVL